MKKLWERVKEAWEKYGTLFILLALYLGTVVSDMPGIEKIMIVTIITAFTTYLLTISNRALTEREMREALKRERKAKKRVKKQQRKEAKRAKQMEE